MYAKNQDSQKQPPITPHKPKQTRSQSDSWKVYGGGALLVLLAFFVTYQFVEPAPPRILSIATGNPDGAYYHFAQAYKKEFEKRGLTLNIRETSGSVENLRLLADEDEAIQLAFVQSGTAQYENQDELIGLASVYLEPVWVFSKTPIASGLISALRGKRVATGVIGSGSHAIATQILSDNGLSDLLTQLLLGGKDAVYALNKGAIDALILTGSYQSPIIQSLLYQEDIHLMSFTRAEAYANRYRYLSQVTLPQGSIDLAADIPRSTIQLIAPAATLIARKDLHPALSDLAMMISR